MHKKVEQFRPFYLMYADIDTYLWWIMDYYGYGKDSAFVKLIDSTNFMDQCDNPQKYKKNADELFLEIRQFLYDNGFEKEVDAADRMFYERCKDRGEKPGDYFRKRWGLLD